MTMHKLTSYQLACGAVQSKRTGAHNMTLVNLWLEHGVYHVRAHDFMHGRRLDWQSFPTLKEAQKCYGAWCRRWH